MAFGSAAVFRYSGTSENARSRISWPRRVKRAAIDGREQPFVGIRHQRLRPRRSVEQPAKLGRHRSGTGVGGIHMEPYPELFGDVSDLGNRIHAGCGRRAGRCHYAERPLARGEVCHDGASQRGAIHPEFGVCRDFAHVLLPDSDRYSAFFDGRVRLLRRVQHQAGVGPVHARARVGQFAGGRDGVHRRSGCRVVNETCKGLWKPHPIAQPSQRDLLQFDDGWAALPHHAVHVEGRCQHLAQDARRRT